MIILTKETISSTEAENSSTSNNVDDEFALFMSEMQKEGAVDAKSDKNNESNGLSASISEELKALEGSKCRAPHQHQWGDVVYHNAMICSISSVEAGNGKDFEVNISSLRVNTLKTI